MPYERDDQGQWWYYNSLQRWRAETRTCVTCGQEFGFLPNSGRTGRFCSRRCSNQQPNRAQYAKGAGHYRWQGGRVKDSSGYVMVKEPGGKYEMEHRKVMAEKLGRPLEAHETVHHINGIKDDNRSENLQLRMGRHGKGQHLRCADCGSMNLKAVDL